MSDRKTVNLLLANSEGRVSNIIEALVRDVCDQKAVVHCTRATHLEELDHQVNEEKFDLVILLPEKLSTAPKVRNPRSRYDRTAEAIRTLKWKKSTPAVAVGVPSEHHAELSDAGAAAVLDVGLKCDEIKSAVRELLHLPVPSAQVQEADDSPNNGSLFSWFQKLTGQN